MTYTDTISIEGQDYDAATGLPLNGVFASPQKTVGKSHHPVTHSAHHVHSKPMRSQTLHRKVVRRPSTHKIVKHEPAVRLQDVRPHSEVRKFAPHPVGALQPRKSMDVSRPAPVHPMVARAHAKSAAKALDSDIHHPTANEIKESSIASAVANTHKRPPLRSRIQPRQRVMAVVSATFALVLLCGYFTYLNMPTISVRVAAAQAGINAGYPDYHPDGYALSGPVTYSEGRVSMNFKANGGPHNFTVTQSESGWNSEAVLDNYVAPRAGSDYIPYSIRGLTIYVYNDNAAWVNGGILYTIEGDAPLSNEQIQRIATSLL